MHQQIKTWQGIFFKRILWLCILKTIHLEDASCQSALFSVLILGAMIVADSFWNNYGKIILTLAPGLWLLK